MKRLWVDHGATMRRRPEHPKQVQPRAARSTRTHTEQWTRVFWHECCRGCSDFRLTPPPYDETARRLKCMGAGTYPAYARAHRSTFAGCLRTTARDDEYDDNSTIRGLSAGQSNKGLPPKPSRVNWPRCAISALYRPDTRIVTKSHSRMHHNATTIIIGATRPLHTTPIVGGITRSRRGKRPLRRGPQAEPFKRHIPDPMYNRKKAAALGGGDAHRNVCGEANEYVPTLWSHVQGIVS